MDNKELLQLASPLMQFGFAGFSLLLLGVIVWMVKQLVRVIEKSSEVVEHNTAAITELTKISNVELDLLREVRDRVMALPNMLKGK